VYSHIEAYLGEHCVLNAQRPRSAGATLRAKVIDYRHLLPALKRKPGALVRWRLRDALFPRSEYAMTWQRLLEQVSERSAARTMVGLLELAASHGCEALLGQRLGELLERNELPDLARLSEEFAPRPAILPSVAVTLPTLASYDELMEVCA
jgi:hypothetical protein